MILSIGTPNAFSDAITICFLTVSSVPGGSEVRSSSVREMRSRSSPSIPAAPKTCSKSTTPPGAGGGGALKTGSGGCPAAARMESASDASSDAPSASLPPAVWSLTTNQPMTVVPQVFLSLIAYGTRRMLQQKYVSSRPSEASGGTPGKNEGGPSTPLRRRSGSLGMTPLMHASVPASHDIQFTPASLFHFVVIFFDFVQNSIEPRPVMSPTPNFDSFQPPKLNGSRGTGTPTFTPTIPALAFSIT